MHLGCIISLLLNNSIASFLIQGNSMRINPFFSLLLGLLLNSSLYAITVKNEPLTNFIQPGEVLYATFPENYFIRLDMESDNFDISQGNIENLDNLKETFQKVTAGRSGCSMSSRTFNASANIVDYNSSYLNGRENINIQGKTSLQFIRCLLESPFISITGNKMKFVDSFLINPKILNIIVDSPESDYDFIQILFYDQPENPTVITGEIDLTNNQMTKGLIISNVKEINVKFKWDKDLPKKSNIEDASTFENVSNVEKASDPENIAAMTRDLHIQKSDPKKVPVINQKQQPRYTCSQFIDKYFKKNILFTKEFIPVALSIAALSYIAYHDIFSVKNYLN